MDDGLTLVASMHCPPVTLERVHPSERSPTVVTGMRSLSRVSHEMTGEVCWFNKGLFAGRTDPERRVASRARGRIRRRCRGGSAAMHLWVTAGADV